MSDPEEQKTGVVIETIALIAKKVTKHLDLPNSGNDLYTDGIIASVIKTMVNAKLKGYE